MVRRGTCQLILRSVVFLQARRRGHLYPVLLDQARTRRAPAAQRVAEFLREGSCDLAGIAHPPCIAHPPLIFSVNIA